MKILLNGYKGRMGQAISAAAQAAGAEIVAKCDIGETFCKVRPYTFHSNLVATRSPYLLLRAGCLAAHRGDCLMLLGSPPDMVHNSRLRKTHSSTQQVRLSRFELTLKKGIHPCCSGFQVQGSANSPASMALFYSSPLSRQANCR